MIYLAVLLMTLIGSLGALFFKRCTVHMEGIFSLFRIPTFYIGVLFYTVGAAMNVVLLRFLDYTVLYPMCSVSYIWSLIISNRLLGERVTGKKVLGVALICVGVVILVQ